MGATNPVADQFMKTDVLLYVSKGGSKSRVTLDLVDQFFRGISAELNSPSTKEFIHLARIPNEREIYGLLVKALLRLGGDADIGHIATEIQVNRIMGEAESDRSTGRVDLLVTFRNTMFLMEVKVVRASINSKGAKGGARSKTEKAWREAVKQLRSIAGEEIARHHNRPVVKLPCLFVSTTMASGWKTRQTHFAKPMRELLKPWNVVIPNPPASSGTLCFKLRLKHTVDTATH